MTQETTTVYDWIGGAKTIEALVNRFYDKVSADSVLRPLFPDDFSDVRQRQIWFLTQFFGGPPLYQEHRGHPMLKMRHNPFRITPTHRDAWLRCMTEALDETGITDPAREFMLDRLRRTAWHMVNTWPDEGPQMG